MTGEPCAIQPPRPRTFITQALITLNAIVFGYMLYKGGLDALLAPKTETVLQVGANFGPLTAGGDYWRILTCMFVHIGILHIGMNMWVLSDVGKVVELLFGPSKFLVIYLLAGL